jgi:hypothetical protein
MHFGQLGKTAAHWNKNQQLTTQAPLMTVPHVRDENANVAREFPQPLIILYFADVACS